MYSSTLCPRFGDLRVPESEKKARIEVPSVVMATRRRKRSKRRIRSDWRARTHDDRFVHRRDRWAGGGRNEAKERTREVTKSEGDSPAAARGVRPLVGYDGGQYLCCNKVKLSPCKRSMIHAKFMRIGLLPISPPPPLLPSSLLPSLLLSSPSLPP